MQIDPSSSSVSDTYQFLTGIVTPRPIAWVTTLSATGVVNLAPFSFFNTFGANPPVIAFSPVLRRDGSKKDTLRNLESLPEFALNSATASLANQVNESSRELPPDESEIELTHLSTTPSVKIRVPRVAEAAASMECRVIRIIPCGTGPLSANIVIAEVVMIHLADELLDANQRVDPLKLKTVARLGADYWCHTSSLFSLTRP